MSFMYCICMCSTLVTREGSLEAQTKTHGEKWALDPVVEEGKSQ